MLEQQLLQSAFRLGLDERLIARRKVVDELIPRSLHHRRQIIRLNAIPFSQLGVANFEKPSATPPACIFHDFAIARSLPVHEVSGKRLNTRRPHHRPPLAFIFGSTLKCLCSALTLSGQRASRSAVLRCSDEHGSNRRRSTHQEDGGGERRGGTPGLRGTVIQCGRDSVQCRAVGIRGGSG